MDFWWIFSDKLKAKFTKKSIIWLLVGKLGEIVKKLKTQHGSKIGQYLALIFNGFWKPTWVQDPPKTWSKSMKNR